MIRPVSSTDVPVQDLKSVPVYPSEADEITDVKANVKQISENQAEEELKRAKDQEKKEQSNETEKISQKMLNEIAEDMEMLHSVGLRFSKHKDTDTTMIKVMDRKTDELIREIPAEKVLDMAAKMDEMIGLLFDREV